MPTDCDPVLPEQRDNEIRIKVEPRMPETRQDPVSNELQDC